MKRVTIKIIIAVLLFGCESNHVCYLIRPLQTYDFVPLNSPNVFLRYVDPDHQAHYQISSQDAYDTYVGFSDESLRPKINFDRQMLLTGKVASPNSGELVSLQIGIVCNEYQLKITIQDGNLSSVSYLNYFLLCERTSLLTTPKVILLK